MALDPMTAELARNPLGTLRRYSVNPPASRQPLRNLQTVNLNDRNVQYFSEPARVQHEFPEIRQRFTTGAVTLPIAWIELEPAFHNNELIFRVEYAAAKDNPADYTDVSPEFEQRIARADRLPVFYLPWLPDSFVRMTIPEYRYSSMFDFGRGVEIDPYCPHLFFTAALSGCSVSVYGDPRQPTVVHVGTMGRTPYGDDCARFWRELQFLERHQRMHESGQAHEVNINDYMGRTSTLQAFDHWLTTQPNDFTVESTETWGAAFGIRYGRLWSFYLQENAYVRRYRIEQRQRVIPRQPKTFLERFQSNLTETVTVDVRMEEHFAMPLSVRPFFPEGSGAAEFWQTFQRGFKRIYA